MINLSPRAQRLILALTQDQANKNGSDQLLPEHALLALLESADGLGYVVLRSLHLNVLTLRLALEQSMTARISDRTFTDIPPSARFKRMMDRAGEEARSTGNDYLGTEHILLAIAAEESSVTNNFFKKAGLSYDQVRDVVIDVEKKIPSSAKKIKGGEFQTSNFMAKNPFSPDMSFSPSSRSSSRSESQPLGKNSILEQFSHDMTKDALEDKADPVIGRENEILRVIQILSRRTKNNPLLVGEPGVGKTAIVEGLAQRIAAGNVPENLFKKRILSLDLAAMIAGTKFRGEFEERMKRMMSEVKSHPEIILFIDEVHTLIGAGGSEGAMDAGNILKPALSRGEIQVIGATTSREYKKYFEKDSALARRFQNVNIEEPDEKDTVLILKGLQKKYEEFHSVHYEDGVIEELVSLSKRYVNERQLPDKAIDILDEAGAAKKISLEGKPSKLCQLEKTLQELTEEKKKLVTMQQYEKAALVRDKVIEVRNQIEDISESWKRDGKVLSVTKDDIRSLISASTGIPLDSIDTSESKRLLKMEEELHKEIIGQNEAVKTIAGCIRRSRTGLSSGKRPLGSFIFLGPTGVGKTQLAKALAKFLFGKEEALIRVDMSDYMEKQNASRLVGAPPGYVGYEEGGMLTDKVRKNPYSVVLLDEIEKAHADVFNLLLQMLEEGELSDNLGHTVSFRNCLVIMTSNAGAREITAESRMGFSSNTQGLLPYQDIKSSAMEELKHIMTPELLNRVDDIIVFEPLEEKEIEKIVDIQLNELAERLLSNSLSLHITKDAKKLLAEKGYNPSMGARPLRRVIEREIEDPLANLILAQRGKSFNTACVDVITDEDGSKNFSCHLKNCRKKKNSSSNDKNARKEIVLTFKENLTGSGL